MKLYSADDIGIDEARRGCRLEMIKIVREVDEVTENPKVATDPSRNWRYLSPHIFRLLLPIVERKPILSLEDVVKLKEKLQKDIEAAIKAKRDEQAPVLSTSTSPPISSSTVTEQKAEDRHGLEAQIKAKKAELDSFRSKLRSLQSSLSQDDMTKIQVKLREDLMAQIQDKQRQLDSVKMGLEMIANASYVTGLEATIQDKLKADLDKQILIKQQEIGFVEQELKLATREDDLASREKKLEAKLARELALQRTEPNVPDHPSPEKPVNPVPDQMDHAFQPPQYQPEPSVPDTSEQPLSNDWHDSVVWIQNQDTDLVLHLAGDPSHNGSPVVGRPLSLEDKAQEWRIKKILGEESWTLTDVKGGIALDLSNGDPNNGGRVQGYKYLGRNPNQEWFLTNCGKDSDGDKVIIKNTETRTVVELESGNGSEDFPVVCSQRDESKRNLQVWKLQKVERKGDASWNQPEPARKPY